MPREKKEIVLLDRRIRWSMGRTIKAGLHDYEFTRIDASEEGTLANGVPVAAGYLELIKDVLEQISTAEKVIRHGGKDLITELSKLVDIKKLKATVTPFNIDEETEDDGEIFEPWEGIPK